MSSFGGACSQRYGDNGLDRSLIICARPGLGSFRLYVACLASDRPAKDELWLGGVHTVHACSFSASGKF